MENKTRMSREDIDRIPTLSREDIDSITEKIGLTVDKVKRIVAEKKELSFYEFIEIVASMKLCFPDTSLCEIFAPGRNEYIHQKTNV